MPNEETLALSDTLWRRVTKKSKGKPLPLIILQTRTLSTAIEILDWIHDMPFEKLSMSLYFYCQDVGMAQFTRAYEAQMELAGANPEKFATGLHAFYNDMSKKILKEQLLDEFFEFYYRCVKLRLKNENARVDSTVATAYQNLLIQQLEYLRPSKFDFNTFVAGRTTAGEIMTRKDYFPTFDIPIYELRSALESGQKIADPEEFLYERYRKAGYSIWSADDQEQIIAQDKIHTTTCCTLLPFINEYTYDILPQQIFNANSNIFHRFLSQIDLDQMKTDLKRRKRTLPTNGVRIVFEGTDVISEILFKEILYDNSIYMLYRMSTKNGDLSGVYETRDGFFYSIFHSGLEEYYWRWFAFGRLAKGRSWLRAALITNGCFMLHHIVLLGVYFGYGHFLTWFCSFGVAVGGFVWQTIYRRSDSVYGGWISHGLIDAGIFALGFYMLP